MRTIPLLLSSSTASGAYNKSSDGSTFSVQFNPPIEIPANKSVSVQVIDVNIWYNTINISTSLGNNKLYYTDDLASESKYSITIPDGIYGLSELNTAIEQGVVDNTHTSGLISLQGENATQKVLIKITATGWQINLTSSDTFRGLIGFDSQKLPASALTTLATTTFRADSVANFSDLEHILLHSSLGGSAVLNGNSTSSLAAITPNVSVGSLIHTEYRHPLQIPINTGTYIDTATFWLTTQDGTTKFNTNSEDWSFRMVISIL